MCKYKEQNFQNYSKLFFFVYCLLVANIIRVMVEQYDLARYKLLQALQFLEVEFAGSILVVHRLEHVVALKKRQDSSLLVRNFLSVRSISNTACSDSSLGASLGRQATINRMDADVTS